MELFSGGITVTAACVFVSFIFYQVGMFLGSTTTAVIQLRDDRDTFAKSIVQTRHFDLLDDGPIPDCAQDVFLTLHQEEGGEDESSCRGMLIRDDIILTSSECSKGNVTFDFPGVGVLQAVPHDALNEKEQLLDSRLGFLEANPPHHFYFIDQPVRRNRMFLSLRSRLGINGTKTKHDKKAVGRCEGLKFIVHNFPVKRELVPLGHLVRVLPEEILWEDTDKDTAYMIEHKSDRWWTRKVTLEEEESTIKDLLEKHTGPPGSVSIPAAHSQFIGKASSLCEAVDPRGHRREMCFLNYYSRWRIQQPFSGQHFFDWLDFGGGKNLLELDRKKHFLRAMMKDDKCSKKDFDRKTVHYFNNEERLAHEIYLTPSEDGMNLIARYKMTDELVPPTVDFDHGHLYMWDLDKKMYIVDDTWDKEKYGTIKHTAVMSGQPALAGGKAYFGENGTIWGVNYSSGHYRPNIQAVSMMYQWMKDQRFNATALHWVGRVMWSTQTCEHTDWNSIRIPGYNATALNQSCHEVTTSPTWLLYDDV